MRHRPGGRLKVAAGLVPFISATLIGTGAGLWYGSVEPGLAAMLGALVLVTVTRFIERVSAHLAESGPPEAEIDVEAGVRRPTAASLEETGGRAGIILLLAASRFWLAVGALAGVLLVVKEHRGVLIVGFVLAVLVDSLKRLTRGLGGAQR